METERQSEDPGLARLNLLGPMRLVAADGSVCTPRGTKARALLAMLALSPRGTRTRAWLRDKLWSNSTEARAASSLRQTIFETKKALGTYANAILIVERNTISLRLDRIWVDVRVATDNPGGMPLDIGQIHVDLDVLEGMDVNDEEFEDWLLLERSNWEEQREVIRDRLRRNTRSAESFRPPDLTAHRNTFTIGLLNSVMHGATHETAHIADHVVESIARNLSEFHPASILDLREASSEDVPGLMISQADYYIRARTLCVLPTITITFLVYGSDMHRLLLSQSIQTTADDLSHDGSAMLHQFIAQNVDYVAKTIASKPPAEKRLLNTGSQLLGYQALSMMFDLGPDVFSRTVKTIDTANRTSDSSLFSSLLAYAASFKVGENLGSGEGDMIKETLAHAQQAVAQNPFNSISLACLGHVYGYVFGQHDIAAEIFERAIKLNPLQAFVWDHYALHKLYIGDLDTAQAASDRAVSLGAYSPLNYTFETTSCMIATLKGDHTRAALMGERALNKQPRFKATMRYALASYGHLGATRKAEALRSALLRIDPDFSDPAVQRSRLRLHSRDGEAYVMAGLRAAGL